MPPSASAPLEPGRDRRLEARLAVYAQHAALVAEQAAAVAAGDLTRAAALDEARARAAEHFAELQAAERADATPRAADAAGSFRDALDGALAELSQQGAVDVALAQRLVALREAVVRGAAWAETGAASAAWTGGAADGAAGGAAARGGALPRLGLPLLRLPAPAGAAAPTAPLEGALVSARAAGVGGVLGGQFPGRLGEHGADWAPAAGPQGGAEPPRLDVRF